MELHSNVDYGINVQRKRSRTLMRRIFALGCLISLPVPVLVFILTLTAQEIVKRYTINPHQFLALCMVIVAMPTVGFALVGIASWRQTKWLLILGLLALLPFTIWTLTALIGFLTPHMT
jgi:hypothetical protein